MGYLACDKGAVSLGPPSSASAMRRSTWRAAKLTFFCVDMAANGKTFSQVHVLVLQKVKNCQARGRIYFRLAEGLDPVRFTIPETHVNVF